MQRSSQSLRWHPQSMRSDLEQAHELDDEVTLGLRTAAARAQSDLEKAHRMRSPQLKLEEARKRLRR